MDSVGSEEMENEMADSMARNRPLKEQVTKIEFYLSKKESAKVKSEEGNSNSAGKMKSKREDISIKLPKIILEQFDGKVQNWQTFWNRFETSIDKKDYLSEVDKFNYLIGLLGENAKECINGLTLSAENYKEAKEILINRFGNPQLIIAIHM